MNILRTVVFPVVRLLVWGVIALSLAWLAFGRADTTTAEVATPSFAVVVPEVAVARGTVDNAITLPGTVSADAAVPVKATAAGKIARLRVKVGDPVEPGTPLLDVVTETPATTGPAGPDNSDGAAAEPPAPTRRTTVVRATTTGTVTALDVLVDQQVAVGDAVASVGPGTLTVTATLTQDQQFRLLSPPTEADVTVPGGPAPFRCADLEIGQPSADAAPAPAPDQNGSPGAPVGPATGSVTCRVPPDATVFAGMSAQLEMSAGVARNVLVLPVTAVAGSVDSGVVWPVVVGGEPAEREVQLGLTDGSLVEIRSGVEEGEQVLQFVPDSDVPAGGPGVEFGGPISVGPGG